MKIDPAGRRDFLRSSLGSAAGVLLATSPTPAAIESVPALSPSPQGKPRIKFSVIGLNHSHIYGQVDCVARGGGELASFYAKEPDLAQAFAKRYPAAKAARSEKEILEDKSVQLVLSAAIPSERAPLGVEVMKHGKDYMSDKPAATTMAQVEEIRRVQASTGRIFSVLFSERLENPATVKAGELVKAGAIGGVIQTIGLGPHRMNPATRPPWFFEREKYGGILCDIASHQFDQFLFFTGSTQADVVAAQVGNVHHPQWPGLEDFGDVVLRGNGGSGYIRVDWFTPDGLNTWGDGRLTILGTEGYIEIRKNIDIAGQPGGSHLFLVDQKSTRRFDCSKDPLPYGTQLVDDVLNRTETAIPQKHCLLAVELGVRAQMAAQKIPLKK
jgi:predicted dehydrogenase